MQMSFLALLKAKLSWLLSGAPAEEMYRKQASDAKNSTSSDQSPYPVRNFEQDYKAASAMLKKRMNKSYPDNFHARLGSGGNNPYDHGEERAYAVDTASAAVALALRNGASVQEAADAEAASVGI